MGHSKKALKEIYIYLWNAINKKMKLQKKVI